MGGIVAFGLLVLYFGIRGLRRACGGTVRPLGATSWPRMMRTAARYAASSGRRR